LKACPIVNTQPLFGGPYFRFNEPDQKRLQDCNIDVLLLFGFGLPDRQVLPLARHGVWFFRDHELQFTGNAPTGFWEVLNQHPVTMQCLLAQHASAPKTIVLHRQYGPTHHRSISLARNNTLWKSVASLSRKLNELQRTDSLDGVVDTKQCCGDDPRRAPRGRPGAPPGEAPSNLVMLKAIGSQLSRFVHERARNLRYFDQWAMAYKYTACELGIDRHFADYRWLIPPKDRFWADPFPVRAEGQDFLFFEERLYSEKNGHLCVAAIDQDGLKEEPKIILKREYHLSYPFVFSWQGQWYLIPESQDAGRIDLFKFDSFPYKLGYYKTLVANVRACDATLFEAHGRWWMFAAIASAGTWNVDELFLFHADNPFGPWAPHPRNPIKSDVRSARPAGRVFARQGKYYRPAQDCSHRYGYAIRLQEIKALSAASYVEEEVEAILPDWSADVVATHTLNVTGALSAIDAKTRRRRSNKKAK
jgi:hypothetical protein